MALRAVTYGAAQGLAQWGDVRAVKPMMEFVEDETWHEEARLAACEAIAWCADEKTMAEVAKKATEFAAKKEDRKQLIGACYASALALKPVPAAVPQLVDLITPDIAPGVRIAIAHAIGISGYDQASEAKLFEKLKAVEVRSAAALALILGGTPETAARTVAMYADFEKESLNDLKDHYFRAFGYWSDEDFKKGNIYRWVKRRAISRIKVNDIPQDWARQRLQAQSTTCASTTARTPRRVSSCATASCPPPRRATPREEGAMDTLKFMKEKGVLMALRGEQGAPARWPRSLHELMNPKAIAART